MGRRRTKCRFDDFTGPDARATGRSSSESSLAIGAISAVRRLCSAVRRAVLTLTLVAAGIAAAAGVGTGARAADGVPLPVLVKASRGESCVEPTPVIRRDHMKFLMHQRDDTVHKGIRGARHSLVGCIDCHAARDDSGQWVRIDAPGQFCESCHAYASVTIDCFGCHAALPTVAFTEAVE